MDMRTRLTSKLLQATSDKTDLNKRALQWKKSFAEVDKVLSGSKKKEEKK